MSSLAATRVIALLVVAAATAACARSPDLTARQAAQPAQIARALCGGHGRESTAACERSDLPEPNSEIAYATCLRYVQRDLSPCGGLRRAYEADLRAYLASLRPPASARATTAGVAPEPRANTRKLRGYAEKLYAATSRDAQTFQAARLIPEIRRKVEQVLGQKLTDSRLRALSAQSEAEALYWFKYMQGLETAPIGGNGA